METATEEIFSSGRRLTFHILLNSAARQLRISRFELHVLRFFNDVFVPHITFGVNKLEDRIWREVVPKYFLSSSLVRQAIFANGCLGLWGFTDLAVLLDVDTSDDTALAQLYENERGDISFVFNDWRVFAENEESNIFRRTATYFSEALTESSTAIAEMQSGCKDQLGEEYTHKAVCVVLSSSLLFGFLGMHPLRVVPLVSFDGKTDLLHIVSGLGIVVQHSQVSLRASDVGDLFHQDEISLLPKKSVTLTEELRMQMDEYYRDVAFLDWDGQMAEEITILTHALDTLGMTLALSVKFNYPVMLFRWLTYISTQFGLLVRSKVSFALRLLYVYSCLCFILSF